MIELMNLELNLDGGQISSSDYEKMKNKYSELIRLLDKNNSDNYGNPYTNEFMDKYNYISLGFTDEFDLWKKLKNLQEYVFEKRGELNDNK